MRVRDLIAAEDLGLRLRTTPVAEHLDREISWVHTSELPDPVPWLGDDELLLTTGMQFSAGVDAAGYVRRLAKSGVVAIGFGIAPVYDAVPESLVTAAEQLSVPLLQVPAATPFIAVSRAVAASWTRRKTEVLQHIIDSQRKLARAAQSPDPESQVVKRLATELGCWALLSSIERDVTAGEPPAGVRSWLAGRVPPPRSASLVHAGHSLLLHRILGAGGQRLLVVGREEPFTTEERSLVLVAESLLSTSWVSSKRATQLTLSSLALDLLLGGQTDVGWQVARICMSAAPFPARWCAVAQHPAGNASRPPAGLITPEGPFLTSQVGPNRLWLLAEEALASFLDQVGMCGDPAGHSDAVPAAHVTAALTQALHAVHLAHTRRYRQPVGPAELAAQSPLTSASPEQRAAAEVLRPLLSDARGEQLMESLRAWFAAGQHWDRAARRSGIHRHTLRQRVDEAFRRLSRDIAEPRDALDVWSSIVLLEGPDAWPLRAGDHLASSPSPPGVGRGQGRCSANPEGASGAEH